MPIILSYKYSSKIILNFISYYFDTIDVKSSLKGFRCESAFAVSIRLVLWYVASILRGFL